MDSFRQYKERYPLSLGQLARYVTDNYFSKINKMNNRKSIFHSKKFSETYFMFEDDHGSQHLSVNSLVFMTKIYFSRD